MTGPRFGFGVRRAAIRARSAPLDALRASIYAAYGLRRLVSTWTGPLVTVRRSSDNGTLDVYPAADGWIDIAALLAWCGTASVYVVRWWDQSGLGRHAEQTTAYAQPQLVNAGALIMLGGRPAVYTQEGRYLTVSGGSPTIPVIVLSSIDVTSKAGSTGRRIIAFGSTAHFSITADVQFLFSNAGSQVTLGTYITPRVIAVVSAQFNASSSYLRMNGTSITGTTGTNSPASPVTILGAATNSLLSIDGSCGELIIIGGAITQNDLRPLEIGLGMPRGIVIA